MSTRRDAFAQPEELIRRVYAYVAYRIGDGPDAEDVTSEAFARALRYKESFDNEKGDAVSWLVGIARRCIATHLGGQASTVPETPDPEASPDVAEHVLRRVELAEALATLPERDRELVAFRYGADLTAQQIAALLELRTNTVEVALHRSLARLREQLEGSDVPGAPGSTPVSVSPASSDS